MSRVMCHLFHFTCHMSCFFLKLFDFFRQNVGASLWRVCYQWGLPRLVLQHGGSQIYTVLCKASYILCIYGMHSPGWISEYKFVMKSSTFLISRVLGLFSKSDWITNLVRQRWGNHSKNWKYSLAFKQRFPYLGLLKFIVRVYLQNKLKSLEYFEGSCFHDKLCTVSVLGRDKGYTVKYNPLPEGVPEGEARGNSWRQRVIFDRISRVES